MQVGLSYARSHLKCIVLIYSNFDVVIGFLDANFTFSIIRKKIERVCL